MILLIFFAFIAGIVTILSPCILPILPVVLSGSVSGGKRRPFGIVAGFVISFTFFTLLLSTIVKATGLPADTFRTVSVIVLIIFGLTLLVPGFQVVIEKLFSRLPQPKSEIKNGFFGGLILGFSLGLLWTPCVGPILASVISLAITGSVNFSAFAITLAYSLGTAIPMFIIIYTGSSILSRLQPYSSLIQKIFGLLMILTALAIYFNLDRRFQTYILQKFPNYGANLTRFESLAVPSLTPSYGLAPELIPGGQWFNSSPLTLAQLKGKVVLIDFWTYTCINCIRTLPYLKAWDDKYRDKGLVIIGVHTPEFEFEKNPDNVKKAIADFGLKYPVMQDNDYTTWNTYQNRYWPAKYLIDKDGRIRYTHFGEGDYDATEKTIQDLLNISVSISNPKYSITARTPELYLGSARRISGYFTTTGEWNNTVEFANPQSGASLTLDFDAKNVFLVMSPRQLSGQVKVFLDDKLQNTITVDSDKLYDLIRLPTSGRHQLRLEFLDSSLNLFAFTFG